MSLKKAKSLTKSSKKKSLRKIAAIGVNFKEEVPLIDAGNESDVIDATTRKVK